MTLSRMSILLESQNVQYNLYIVEKEYRPIYLNTYADLLKFILNFKMKVNASIIINKFTSS